MHQKSDGFRCTFNKRVRKTSSGRSIRVPDFPLEDVEDCYTFYVLIIGISEDVFWNADISFIKSVVADKTAYESWITSEQNRLLKNNRR
jgi:hypothetical protein